MTVVDFTVGSVPAVLLVTGSMPLANLVVSTAAAAILSVVTAPDASFPASTAPAAILLTVTALSASLAASICPVRSTTATSAEYLLPSQRYSLPCQVITVVVLTVGRLAAALLVTGSMPDANLVTSTAPAAIWLAMMVPVRSTVGTAAVYLDPSQRYSLPCQTMVLVLLTVGSVAAVLTDTGSMPLANLVASTACAASLLALTEPLARLPASTISGPRSLLPILPVCTSRPLMPPAGDTDCTPSWDCHLIHSR